jgi:hypothetical protein
VVLIARRRLHFFQRWSEMDKGVSGMRSRRIIWRVVILLISRLQISMRRLADVNEVKVSEQISLSIYPALVYRSNYPHQALKEITKLTSASLGMIPTGLVKLELLDQEPYFI